MSIALQIIMGNIKNGAEKSAPFSYKLIIALILVLASCLGFLTTLDAGALVVLLLSQICHNTGLCTAALESLKSVVERFVFLDVDFRHLFHSLR